MSVATSANTNIRDECYAETQEHDNNRASSNVETSPAGHRNGGSSASNTGDSLSEEEHISETGDRNIGDNNGDSPYHNKRNNICSLKSKPDTEAKMNYSFEEESTKITGFLDIKIGNQRVSSSESAEKESEEDKKSSKKIFEGKEEISTASPLSITGIVQRNLGRASDDPSLELKESIYNFDESEEEQCIPKSAILTNILGKESKFTPSKIPKLKSGQLTPQRFSINSSVDHSPSSKSNEKQEPSTIFVAKKSRPILTNEIKGTSATKKPKKKHGKKEMKPDKNEEPKPVVEPIDKRILSLDTTKNLYKEGYLVWGKIRGFSYWPGIITVDPMDGLTVKFMKQNSDIPYSHVHFLGYERTQRAWLPETNIMEFKGIDHFVDMGSKVPANSAKKKDFTPKKSLLERFEKGMDLAESVLSLTFRQRLEKLDLVYVLIPGLKLKEEKERRKGGPESQQEDPKPPKGVKRKREIVEDEVVGSSATPGKKKRRKKDVVQVTPDMMNLDSNVPNTELKVQIPKEAGSASEYGETEDLSKIKKPKEKKPRKSLNGKNVNIAKVDTNDNSKSAKKGKEKQATAKKPSEKATEIKQEKDVGQTKHKKQSLNTSSTNKKTKINSPSEIQKFEDIEECGNGVTVRVSSPTEDTSENEIKDIQGTLKADEFDSDFDDDLNISASTNSATDDSSFKQNEKESIAEPKLGGLVWGRLAGFPYWPCFVTKCPDTGEHRRLYDASKRCDYHVQFFNWNNESGWVRNTKPWCTIEEFQDMAKTATKRLIPTSKEYKAWRPTGKLLQKWTAAFNEAQSTSGMTRRERHDSNITFYRSKMEQSKMATLISEGPHAKKRRKSSSIQDGNGSDIPPLKNKVLSTATKIEENSPKSSTKPSKLKGFRKPCPKSVQNQISNSQRSNTKQSGQSSFIVPEVSKAPKLPPGWSMKLVNSENSHEYKSPEGIVFPSLKTATSYLFDQNSLQNRAQNKCKKDITVKEGLGSTRRRRCYSLNEALLPYYRTSFRDNVERSVASDENNVVPGCDGWFLKASDEIHYGVPKTNLKNIKNEIGSLEVGNVEYFTDNSLPSPPWYIRKMWKTGKMFSSKIETNPSIKYICQKFVEKPTQEFNSKLEVVKNLDGIGHPAIQLEQMLRNFTKPEATDHFNHNVTVSSKDTDLTEEHIKEGTKEKELEDVENEPKYQHDEEAEESLQYVLSPINLCEWSVDQARKHPILGRAVTPCYVDMVQLPGIFLQHPSVRVEESENEMVISDYYTREFIAKKIIYD